VPTDREAPESRPPDTTPGRRVLSPGEFERMKQSNEQALRQHALVRPKPPTREETQRNLQSEDPDVRKSAARALWKMGAKAAEAIPVLIEALDDAEPEVRGFAARALGQMGAEAKGAVPALTEMLSDQATYSVSIVVFEPGVDFFGTGRGIGRGGSYREEGTHTVYVRANAAEALGRIGPTTEETVTALTGLLDDAQPSVRGSAARALGRIGAEAMPTILALTQLLHDEADYHPEAESRFPHQNIAGFDRKTVRVCDSVAEVLAQIGPETTLPALKELLDDEEAEARRGAAKALGLLGIKAQTAVPDLIAVLQDKSWQVRLSATEALGAIGPDAKAAVPDLVGLLLEEDQEDGHAAPVERMRRALDLRQAVADALRKMLPDATASLSEMLQDEDNRVRTTTAYVVGEIGPQAKAIIPDLTELLQDEDHQVRAAAVWALGKMEADAKDAIPDLKSLLEDENELVRQTAAEALKAIGQRED
jgi:HEAT repeat protein